MDIARAIAEAQRAGIGPLGSSSGANGSPARVKGSLWGTDQGLLAYSDLMLAVPDELSSMATALHCMVRASRGLTGFEQLLANRYLLRVLHVIHARKAGAAVDFDMLRR